MKQLFFLLFAVFLTGCVGNGPSAKEIKEALEYGSFGLRLPDVTIVKCEEKDGFKGRVVNTSEIPVFFCTFYFGGNSSNVKAATFGNLGGDNWVQLH